MRLPIFLTTILLLTLNANTLAAQIPDEIKSAIKSRVDFGLSKGIVVGYFNKKGVSYFGYGKTKEAGETPNEHTIFEIGSITKVFTSALLVDAHAKGDIQLGDPITKYLAKSLISERLSQITPAMLATHHSGLPRMPSNYAEPYYQLAPKGYTREGLYAFLQAPEFISKTDEQYHYSNLGYGLLGHVLEIKTGMSLQQLLAERITKKLGMKDTAFAIEFIDRKRLAQGHHGDIETANWPNGMLDGSGSILSTASDLIAFLKAHFNDAKSELTLELCSTLRARKNAWEGTDIGLGWHINKLPDGKVIHWHNGSSGGFHGFVGMDLAQQKAVVVLANSGGDGNDDIGFHLLDPGQPIKPTPTHQETSLPEELLSQYVGIYDTDFGVPIEITLQNKQLKAKFGDQFALKLYPSSKSEFFYRAIDAQIEFATGTDGKAMLYLLQDGEKYPANKSKMID